MNTPTTPLRWNTSGSREVHTTARPRWGQLRQGLNLVVLGEILLLAFVAVTALFLGPWAGLAVADLGVAEEDLPVLGWGLGGGGVLLGYLVLLLGQWRCLVYAPQGNGAKELQYAALLCSLAAPVLFLVAHRLGGTAEFAALADLDLLHRGTSLLVLGLVVVFLGVVLLSGFARAVNVCLRDEAASRRAGYYFWYVAFLIGGTAGVVLQVRRGGGEAALPALGLGWALCLVWHQVLVVGTARRVVRILNRRNSRQVPALRSPGREEGQVTLRAASFLHDRN